MRRAGFEPLAGVVDGHAATQMHSARESRKRRFGRLVVAVAKLDDMASAQAVLTIQVRKPGGGLLGDEVGLQTVVVVSQRPTDDLLHLAFVQIDAGTKHDRIEP